MRTFLPSPASYGQGPFPAAVLRPGFGTPTALRIPDAAWGVASPPGVTVNAGVNLTVGMERFLTALRARLPSSVPVTVTSGTRTVEEQASAMLKKLAAGGAQELYAVYADDATISVLLKTPQSVSAWASVIRARAPTMSRHMSGRALDLHTRTLTSAQVQQLKAAAEALGARTLLEAAPPHLHVDLPSNLALLSVGETVARRGASLWALSVGAGALVVGGLIAVDLFRRRAGGPPRGAATASLHVQAEIPTATPTA